MNPNNPMEIAVAEGRFNCEPIHRGESRIVQSAPAPGPEPCTGCDYSGGDKCRNRNTPGLSCITTNGILKVIQ